MKHLSKFIKLTSLLLIFLILPGIVAPVFAQDVSSVGIATYMQIEGTVEDGDIISSTKDGYRKSQGQYDPQITGIVATKPAIALKLDNEPEGIPVVSVGTAFVKVSGANGNIKKGDFVAASDIPGVGMRSSRTGYVIGESLQDASFNNTTEIKKIPITLNLHFLQVGSQVNTSLFQVFRLSEIAAYEEPLKVFKYVISAIVLIISFGFGFLIFSRAIKTGIEAIGRNPLAGRMIQLSILFNVVLVIIIIMTGLGIVWLFLQL